MRKAFEKINTFLDRFLWVTAPLGILVGLLLGERLKSLKPWGIVMFAIMTFTGSIFMRVSDFQRVLKKPKNLFLFLCTNHIIIPFIGIMLAKLFFKNSFETVEGIALLLGGPCAVTSFMWTSVFKGDSPLSLTIIMLDTVLTPILLPLTIKVFLGSSVVMNTSSLILSLCYMVVIPVLLAVLINELTKGAASKKAGLYLKPFGKLALFFALAINSSMVRKTLNIIGLEHLQILILCVFITLAGFFISYLISTLLKVSKEARVTLTFSSGTRNTSAALVVAVTFFSPEAGIPIIATIIFQQIASAIISNFLFKKELEERIAKGSVV